MTDADIHFYFDPVCPFAWMTSKWVRLVQAQRDYTVDWRFISLRLVNADVRSCSGGAVRSTVDRNASGKGGCWQEPVGASVYVSSMSCARGAPRAPAPTR